MGGGSIMGELARTGGHVVGFATTTRTDRWWIGPLLTILGLGGFAVYTTWAAFQGSYYFSGSYLSPFYSPLLFVDPAAPGSAPLEHAWLGRWPAWLPSRSEEHTSELQSPCNLVCRLLLEKKKKHTI